MTDILHEYLCEFTLT